MGKPAKILLIACGTLCVALGAAGMILPVLPTTPFLLLAAACYARSSVRFYRWLLVNRWFGAYIRHYREGTGMPLIQKMFTIALLWASIGATAWLAISAWWLRLILFGVAAGVTIHLARIKTSTKEPRSALFPEESNSPEEIGG